MNVEFHYYIVHWLAMKAGMTEDVAWVIAYSSQHVDASTVHYAIRTPLGVYDTMITQDYGFWDSSFPRTVYVPFHFFPGDTTHPGARRVDGKTNPLNTTPGSPAVKELLVRALKTRNPYRVGIALHTYADSWAHQNFSGVLEDWNTVDTDTVIPAIGHAQALQNPDRLTAVWEDPRLAPPGGTVRNLDRQKAAARMVYKYLATYNRRSFEDVDWVLDELIEILNPLKERRTGEERILDLIISANLRKYGRRDWLQAAARTGPSLVREEELSGYDKLVWLRDAALYRTSIMKKRPLEAREDFDTSHLKRWNDAAREHLQEAWSVLPAAIAELVRST